MSWDYDRYSAICRDCGETGVVVIGSDDWGRTSRRFEGFKNVAPSPSAVGRKRADARDHNPLCGCGSSNVERGEMLPAD